MTGIVSEPRLEMRNVKKTFGDVTAVKDSSFSIARGEFLSLLGPSGCGKSTTLSLIAGFLGVDSGEIVVDGKVVNDVSPQKRRIGLVFQDYAIFSRLTVLQNLSFGLEAQKVPRLERGRRIDETVEKLDLGSLLKRRGGNLNMSEMQRVAIARVLVTEPELLLLDEPMSNLDASLRSSLRGELKKIQKDLNQTVLYVTHDQIEAMSMSDRIAIMHDGELLQLGSPDEIYHRPVNKFVAQFIGDPPINLIDCDIKVSGGLAVAKTAVHGDLQLGRRRIVDGSHVLGVRPHDVLVSASAQEGYEATTVRFVENLGSEHVLHVEYGNDLVATVAPPGFASADDTVFIRIASHRVHAIDRQSERVVPSEDDAGENEWKSNEVA